MREEENESEEGAVEDDYGSGEISFRQETLAARSASGEIGFSGLRWL